MKAEVKGIILVFSILFTTCGIFEYYYLPQIPEGIRVSNTSVTMNIPSVNTSMYHYARGYTIYYRIYLSNHPTDVDLTTSEGDRQAINQILWAHYNAFFPFTDPATTTPITMSTFLDRNFYELDIVGADIRNVLTLQGGLLSINFFHGEHPFLTVNEGTRYPLSRTNAGRTFFTHIIPDYYFNKTDELNIIGPDTNLDVERLNAANEGSEAYVLMYLVMVGENPENFTSVLSKPTLISIFRLPLF
jgi:hypothetical protein